jgi:two-component system chemotaxis response regulator CheB
VLKIKVLVVDDSMFMRKLITRLIEEDTSLQVIGTARNGSEAVTLVKELKPHVVTLDIEMPEMNGLDALTKIMKECPTPVLMLSSLTQEGAHATITALQNGAVDFIAKPSGSISTDLFRVKDELVSKIKLAARMTVRTLQPLNRIVRSIGFEQKQTQMEFNQIVTIGTSTGGPKALETVITALPANFPYPVLVVQHMPPKFTKSLAERLDRISNVRVVEAEDNQPVTGGTVYIAPGDYHMTVTLKNGKFRIHLHQQPPVNGHRPSVDVLFESINKLGGLKRHYVLMTGMGNDGAKGMLLAKKAGASSTIAEAKETCVVYGMPKSAVELNCVDYIIPLYQIASKIVRVTNYR